MNRDELIEWCRSRGACREALEWLGDLSESATLAEAWARCDRGDWMLWLATNAGVGRPRLVEAACDCAETALVHVTPGEDRPARAVAIVRAWARDAATYEDVRAAARDAFQAAYDASSPTAHAAARAADAAAYAACAACASPSSVYAADAAAYDAHAAAYADGSADYAAVHATRAAAYAQHAAIVRSRISAADIEAAMKEAGNDAR